jgi:putative transposase
MLRCPVAVAGLHAAVDVHYGRAAALQAGRAQVLTAAYLAHPERVVRNPPTPPGLPDTSRVILP